MAKILVGSTALLGHIVPLAPIVAELVERGNDVLWYTGRHYRNRVEATGATYLPPRFAEDFSEQSVNDRFPRRAALTGVHSLLFDITHLFAAQAVGQTLDLQETLRTFPADAIFADAAFLAAGWTHELGGPPWAVLNPFAINLSGDDTPPFGLGSPPATSRSGQYRVALQQALVRRFLYRDSTRYIDRLRRRVGLPPTGEIFWDRTLSPYLYMQGSIREMEYPRSDLPPQFHFIGPTVSGRKPVFDPPEWWADLMAETPVVHVTQGTISNNPEQLLLPAIRALGCDDVLIVVTTGGASSERLTRLALPSNVRVEPFIPYDHLLPHVDVMVTNGGYNGVQLALSYGVPLVVAGATEDKLEVNARVSWTGVGIDLNTASPSENQMRDAVFTVLANQRFRLRAEAMAQAFQRHSGPATGADLLEALARTGKPVASGIRLLDEPSR